MGSAGMKADFALRKPWHLIVVDRGDVIPQALLYYAFARFRERFYAVKNIQGFAGLQLQILGCVVISAPGHKHYKGKHHSVKEAERVEDDCSDFMVLPQHV